MSVMWKNIILMGRTYYYYYC